MAVDIFSIFIICCLLLVMILLTASLLSKEQTLDYEKLSTYECGFISFANARGIFEVTFYVIAILFLIFDVELVIFIPIILAAQEFSTWVIFTLYFLSTVLLLGFILEWKKISIFATIL